MGIKLSQIPAVDDANISDTDLLLLTDVLSGKNFSRRITIAQLGSYVQTNHGSTVDVPSKATNDIVDAETDDTNYMTAAKTYRAIGRKVKTASTTTAGIGMLARVTDVDANETDTGRLLTVASGKTLIERLAPPKQFVPPGGSTSQILEKKSGTDYDTQWVDKPSAGTSLSKATNNDVDTETDDAKYVTVAKVFRAIARKVKTATNTVAGIVTLARNEDVDGTETDTTRIPTVALVKRLTARLYLPLSGGTLTGALTLKGDPTDDLHAVTKKYADAIKTGTTVLSGTRSPTGSDGVDTNLWLEGSGNGNIIAVWENVEGNWVELVRVADSTDEVRALQHLSRDLHALIVSPEWTDASDSDGDLYHRLSSDTSDLADSDFDNNGASATSTDQGNNTTNIYVRLPAASDHTDFRLEVDSYVHWLGNSWTPATGPDTDTYQYWFAGDVVRDGGSTFQLQKHPGSLAKTRYDGALGGEAKKYVDDRIPPFPDEGKRNGKIPKFDGNTLKWLADAGGGDGGGEENVQSDWDQTDDTADDFIKNKPTLTKGDKGDDGPQGAFYLELRLSAATKPNKPTALTYDYDNDTFSVTPNTWKLKDDFTPTAGQRVYEVRAAIDPRNDEGKGSINILSRLGNVIPITGEKGAKGDKGDASTGTGEENVQSDWDQTDDTKDDFVKNKPKIKIFGNFNDFPAVADYDVGDILSVSDQLYELGITDENTANLYEATVGRSSIHIGDEHWRGVSNSQSPNGFSTDGGWSANPSNAIALIMASDARHIRVAIKKSVFDAAKGSAFVSSDHLYMSLALESGNSDTVTMAYYNSYSRDETYLVFQHKNTTGNYHLYSEAAGNNIGATFRITSSSGNLIAHAVSTKHWLLYGSGDGDNALQLAQANQARLDALDVHVDGATPNQTFSFNKDNVTFSHTAFTQTIGNVKNNDLIAITWENFHPFRNAIEHVLPGSSDAEGRMYFRVSDLSSAYIGGQLGKVTGINRLASDSSDDTLNSRLELDMRHSGTSITLELAIDVFGSANDVNLIPPANMMLKIDIYRNTTADNALNSVHAQLAAITAMFGNVGSFQVLTNAEYTALATKDPKRIYFRRP